MRQIIRAIRTRDVVADHATLAGRRYPPRWERIRSAKEGRWGAPRGARVGRREKANLQRGAARCIKVIRDAKLGRTARSGLIHRQSWDHMLDTAARPINRHTSDG